MREGSASSPAGRLRKAGYYLCAPAVCLALFWRVLFTWFHTIDFRFLWLASTVHGFPSLGYALFHPVAQGTVRVLSDRVFFLALYWLFGIAAGPFHVAILLTWFAALALAAAAGGRMTGSRAAGLLAALFWTASRVMVNPLATVASYEVVLLAMLALASLHARIQWLQTSLPRWRTAEWIFYLLGYGAQESMVMYPAVAVLYTWAVARRDVTRKGERGVFLLFLPAVIFTVSHFLFIPKPADETYRIAVDWRLPATLWSYLRIAVGPERDGLPWVVPLALAAFALWRRDWLVLFCAGWFVLWLAPVLLLPNHISEYYLTVPLGGLAWMAGWALVAAWRAGWLARAGSAACLALHLTCHLPAIAAGTAWYQERTAKMRLAFRGIEEAAFQHPGTMVLFKGVDNDLFKMGFEDNPFVLAGASQGFLAPGTEKGILARSDQGGLSGLTISEEAALRAIENGRARVLEMERDGPPHDITGRYEAVLRAALQADGHDSVDVGLPPYSARLGPSWHKIENGYRWMPKSATVQLAGPRRAGEKLHVTGFGAAQALASGPVTLRFRVAGQEVGTATVAEPDRPFQVDFALPEKLVGASALEVSVESSKTFRVSGDGRELGMIFGTFSIR